MKRNSIKVHPPWYARGTPVVNPRDGPAAARCGTPGDEIIRRKIFQRASGAFISHAAVPHIALVRSHNLFRLYGYIPPLTHRQGSPARGNPMGKSRPWRSLALPPEHEFDAVKASRRIGTGSDNVGMTRASRSELLTSCFDYSGSWEAAADLSAFGEPDNVKLNEDRTRSDLSGPVEAAAALGYGFDAVKSNDVDRSGKAAVDLSTFAEPARQIRIWHDNVKIETRASPGLSGSGDAAAADLSAFAEPDNVELQTDNVNK